eukprot:13258619-Alexandrium_andersonii.AAC.1
MGQPHALRLEEGRANFTVVDEGEEVEGGSVAPLDALRVNLQGRLAGAAGDPTALGSGCSSAGHTCR